MCLATKCPLALGRGCERMYTEMVARCTSLPGVGWAARQGRQGGSGSNFVIAQHVNDPNPKLAPLAASSCSRGHRVSFAVMLFPHSVLRMGRKHFWRVRDEVTSLPPPDIRTMLIRRRGG